MMIRSIGPSLQRLPVAWDAFWFTPEAASNIGITRVAIACVAILQFMTFLFWVPEWLSGDGWFDLETGRFFIGEGLPDTGSQYRWSLLFRWTTPWVATGVCIVGLLASIATALGWCARIAPLLAWACFMTIHHRAPWLTMPAEMLLAAGLIYLVIDPGRLAWSFVPRRHDPDRRATVRLARRCIQVHLVLWLLLGTASMLQQNVWWNGSAISILAEQGHSIWKTIDRSGWFGQSVTLAMVALPIAAVFGWTHSSTKPLGFLAILCYAIGVILFAGDGCYALALLAMSTSLLPCSQIESEPQTSRLPHPSDG